MKKLLCLVLVFVLSMTVIVACGKKGAETTNAENDIVATDDINNKTPEEEQEELKETEKAPVVETAKKPTPSKTEEPSEKVSEPAIENNSSDKNFSIILNGTKEESILYHTYNCPTLNGRETRDISMEIVETLQFRCCSTCNPVKYDGYVE